METAKIYFHTIAVTFAFLIISCSLLFCKSLIYNMLQDNILQQFALDAALCREETSWKYNRSFSVWFHRIQHMLKEGCRPHNQIAGEIFHHRSYGTGQSKYLLGLHGQARKPDH